MILMVLEFVDRHDGMKRFAVRVYSPSIGYWFLLDHFDTEMEAEECVSEFKKVAGTCVLGTWHEHVPYEQGKMMDPEDK